jgi:hypothetical protein
MTKEIGRELKVSELVPRTVVVVNKGGKAATMWVVEVAESHVHFYSGVVHTDFIASRTGPDRERITDDTNSPMRIFEYLGEA